MRLVIAQMQHETNTFSPVPTPWEAFGRDGPYLGDAALAAMRGTRMAIGGFIDVALDAGAQIVTPIAGYASPSGPVDGEAWDGFCERICDAVAAGCDAVMLDLHGAMVVADRTDDGEGALLEQVRRIAPHTPIAVSLNLHANVSESLVRDCDTKTVQILTAPLQAQTSLRAKPHWGKLLFSSVQVRAASSSHAR